MDADQATNIIMEIIRGLKGECKKHKHCNESCKLYDINEGFCLLHHDPCDYDVPRIEESIYNMIKEEIENDGKTIESNNRLVD